MMTLFQSTHPTRECDQFFNRFLDRIVKFQSTHPTRECDSNAGRAVQSSQYFNPRTLQESATAEYVTRICLPEFQSTHPTRECDVGFLDAFFITANFNPRTLQESATAIYSKKITFSQYIGLKILIRNKKYPSLK